MEEEVTGQRQRRTKQAIDLAVQGRWREAVKVNQEIVDAFPDDVSAYNRLGRAHLEIGSIAPAIESYRRAMEIDPYNAIARKNLDRLSRLGEDAVDLPEDAGVNPQQFIEETGKAGLVRLYQLGKPGTIAKMVAGDKVYLKAEGMSLLVSSGSGEYLGQVDPRHAQRLTRLMQGGNEYSAAIVNANDDSVTVIIRQVYQHPSQLGRLSFPAKDFKSPHPYVSEKVVHREPELEYEEEEEETADEEEVGYATIVDVDNDDFGNDDSDDDGKEGRNIDN
jgi:tetratricopeptide (TPR) repeat protein